MAVLAATALAAAAMAWGRLSKDSDPDAVLALLPWHPGAKLEAAESRRGRGEGDPATLAATGRQIFRAAPLLDAPLVFAGLDHAARGDERLARLAFEAALRRQPRNVPALSWSAATALREGRHEDALGILDQLWRVNPDSRKLYAEALASIVADPQGAKVLKLAVASGSPVGLSALELIIVKASDLDVIILLVAAAPSLSQRAVDRVIRERGVDAGFIAWLSLQPDADAKSLSWPYDPAFVEGHAPEPFNWKLGPQAERLPEGGLLVRYSGRGTPLFARQIMLLTPGAYRFSAEMDGDLSGSGGAVVWQMECLPSEQMIGQVPAISATQLMSTHTFDFTVPPQDCPAQSLTLRGKPSEFPQRVRTTVRHVSIVQGRAAAL